MFVIVSSEIPLVVHISLWLPSFKFTSSIVIMQERPVTLSGFRIRRRSTGFFHDVLGEHTHITVNFALLGIQF